MSGDGAFRGIGIGPNLFHVVGKRAQDRQRHVYVLSRNPQVVGWMREMGMTVNGKLWCAPLAVHWFMQWYMMSWHRIMESGERVGRLVGGLRLV